MLNEVGVMVYAEEISEKLRFVQFHITEVLHLECRACGSAHLEVRDDAEYCRDCGAKNR